MVKVFMGGVEVILGINYLCGKLRGGEGGGFFIFSYLNVGDLWMVIVMRSGYEGFFKFIGAGFSYFIMMVILFNIGRVNYYL